MAFNSTGKSFITMMKGNTSFLFVNSILTVSFFGFGIQSLANAISEIGGDVEWEKGLVFTSLFLICMVGFIDTKDTAKNRLVSFRVVLTSAIVLMLVFTSAATIL